MFKKIICDLPVQLLALVLSAATLSVLGFCCGVPLDGWVLWSVFTCELAGVAFFSRKSALRFAIVFLRFFL